MLLLVVNLECHHGARQAEFWTAAANYRIKEGSPKGRFTVLESVDGSNPEIVLQEVDAPSTGQGRVRFELGVDSVATEVPRLEALGAQVKSPPQREVGHEWAVMTDPEGNEFWLISPLHD